MKSFDNFRQHSKRQYDLILGLCFLYSVNHYLTMFLTSLKNISHFPSQFCKKILFVIITSSENFGHENFHSFDLTKTIQCLFLREIVGRFIRFAKVRFKPGIRLCCIPVMKLQLLLVHISM